MKTAEYQDVILNACEISYDTSLQFLLYYQNGNY